MSVIRKLRAKFIAVFMALMMLATLIVSSVVYYQQKSALEYDSMVYLLNIVNFDNVGTPTDRSLAGYPPYFVLEINNQSNSCEVVTGTFFLSDQGIEPQDLMQALIGHLDESGILDQYQIRYFNGPRQTEGHRVAFMDISYISRSLNRLLGRIALIAVPGLLLMLGLSFLLARWFSRPAKDAMEEQNRFISKIAHELKTPLSIISANIDLLEGSKGTDEADFVFGCDNIRHECQRMTSLMDTMLWVALPAQTDKEDSDLLDLSRLVEREALRFEVVAFDRGLTFTMDIEPGLTLRGNETQLNRLVDIILDNAVKYCDPGGEIQFRAVSQGPRHVQLSYANTGAEIPREHLQNLFKPFYQADGSSRGAGLGLSIANEIVTAMHGKIRVEHRGDKNCFIIDL